MIEELVRGKNPDDDLLPGFPVPPSGSQIERSMPAVKAFTTAGLSVWMSAAQARGEALLTSTPSADGSAQKPNKQVSLQRHKRQGETFGSYSAGPSMEQFRRCVEAVKLP
jgi:hypothetical protein